MKYPDDFINKIIQGDCLDVMPFIPDKSIDMILCDLPYVTTACKWDIIIPFELLWKQYKRIIKDNGAIVLTASQPFTSMLVMSNLEWFKYEWIWEKAVGSNFATLKYQPMKEHENILVFSKGKHNYYPIKQQRKGSGAERMNYAHNCNLATEFIGGLKKNQNNKYYDINNRYPSSVQYFNNREKDRGQHPTQKPVALFEYLIKTYTNESDLVLDNCAGSGTTGVACKNLGRDFILIEKMKKYVGIARKRVNATPEPLFT
jgi:site-specific DNA-methyltransferase (adenine-specific)